MIAMSWYNSENNNGYHRTAELEPFANISNIPITFDKSPTTPKDFLATPSDTSGSMYEMSKLLPNNLLWDDTSSLASNTANQSQQNINSTPMFNRSITPLTNFSTTTQMKNNTGLLTQSLSTSNFNLYQQQQQAPQQIPQFQAPQQPQQPTTIGLTLEQQQLLIQQQFVLQQQLQQLQSIQQPNTIQPAANNIPLTEANLSLLSSPPVSNDVTPPTVATSTSSGTPLNQQQQSQRKDSNSGSQTNVNPELYKTELCQQFMKKNSCPYGSKCQFAHGEHELKFVKRPNNWKTKDCANWTKFGECRYGRRCCFKHGEN